MNQRQRPSSTVVLCLLSSSLVFAGYVAAGGEVEKEPASLPKDVPPVVGTAVFIPPSTPGDDGPEEWSIRLSVPKVAWEIVGERRPKIEWPTLEVQVEEAILHLPMGYHPATQLSEDARNRILDLKGRTLGREDARKRLATRTPVLVSVSGRRPDPFYLQCSRPDTLVVVLGIPSSPAPELLPAPAGAGKGARPGAEESETGTMEASSRRDQTYFKGWELYVWEDGDSTFFSLLEGTNRLKTEEEIAAAAVKGFEAIRPALYRLRKGESVLVHGRRLLTEAPPGPAKVVAEYCKKIGLKVQ